MLFNSMFLLFLFVFSILLIIVSHVIYAEFGSKYVVKPKKILKGDVVSSFVFILAIVCFIGMMCLTVVSDNCIRKYGTEYTSDISYAMKNKNNLIYIVYNDENGKTQSHSVSVSDIDIGDSNKISYIKYQGGSRFDSIVLTKESMKDMGIVVP